MKTKINSFRALTGPATGVLMGLTLASPAPVRAQDAKPEEKKGWETVASAGVTLTRGNSDNFLATLGLDTKRKWSKDEMLLGASGGFGENTKHVPGDDTTTKTDQYIKGYGQWNHLFTERNYAGVRADAIYDEIAAIDYRVTLSPLAGHYFIKNAQTFLSGEIGPSVVFENTRTEESTVYFAFRVAERFEHKFNDRTKIWQTAEWIPQVDNINNWLLNFEIGVSSALTKSMDLQVKLVDTYDREPAPGRRENDLKLIAGLAYKF
jgi:putative salt-induced outer membrane protein YdiY